MDEQNKKFILEELIPFVLREQGSGFAMAHWLTKLGEYPSDTVERFLNEIDGVVRTAPACNTVACIGGSVELLLLQKGVECDESSRPGKLAEALGLTEDQADGLFYGWQGDNVGYNWPEEYIKEWEAVTTPLAKAKVAVALLREVVETEGDCLSGNEQ